MRNPVIKVFLEKMHHVQLVTERPVLPTLPTWSYFPYVVNLSLRLAPVLARALVCWVYLVTTGTPLGDHLAATIRSATCISDAVLGNKKYPL